jgi:signal transduction histidine kinase
MPTFLNRQKPVILAFSVSFVEEKCGISAEFSPRQVLSVGPWNSAARPHLHAAFSLDKYRDSGKNTSGSAVNTMAWAEGEFPKVNRFADTLYAAGHKSFDLPIERLVALLRIALTCFCFVVISILSGRQVQYREPLEFILIAYALFGVGVALLPTIGKLRTGWQLPVHVIDVGVVSILMYFIETVSAAFLILYVFVLMSATYRWNWRGALLTTIAFPALQLVFSANNPVTTGFMIQCSFLFIVGGVFVFFGVSRERSAERLTQIANWPNNRLQSYANVDDRWLDASLNHIATVFQAPRVLLLWEITQEPYCFSALLTSAGCDKERTTTTAFDSLVSAEIKSLAFAAETAQPHECFTLQGVKHCVDPVISESLKSQFNISSVCSAPFSSDYCRGRVFILDRSDWREDDLTLAEIVASRLHLELEYYAVSVELRETAASRERVRLARDLHDGVLQTLTGAALQLSSIASPMSQDVKQKLDGVRELLLGEQQRIREFVEGRQSSPRSENLNLNDEIQREVARIERQWGCSATLSATTENASVSSEMIRQLRFLLAEGAANAVKHGKASHINLKVEQTPKNVRLQIADNGHGLPGITGSYTQDELGSRRIGPQSIAKRVTELGGTLSISSSDKGVELCIELPCDSQPAQEINEQAYSVG